MTIRTPRFLFTALATGAVVSIAPLHAPPVKRVTLTIQSPTLVVGATTTTTVVAKRANGDTASTKTATWGSSKTDIATVTVTSGVIKAIAPGTATITAIVSGASGAAIVTVTAAPPAPPPPPVAVASINVTVGQALLSIGKTTQASAIARDSSGDVLTNRVTAWGSSAPTIASVSTTGLVSALTAGAANIVATVETKTGSAAVTVAPVIVVPPPDTTPPPKPSPGHPNEPAGFTQLSPTLSGDSVPLTTSGPLAAYELGWVQRNMSEITQVIDTAVPFASKKVLNINFPSGMIGGGSPGQTWTYQFGVNPSNWPQQPTQLYLSFWYKLSPNFPANLVANKITYTNIGGGNKGVIEAGASGDYPMGPDGKAVFVQNGATQYTAAIFPSFCVQNIVSIDGNPNVGQCLNPNLFGGDPANWPQIKRGRWYHWEVLYVANTAGKGDGGGAIWIDGQLVSDWRGRIKWSETADHFQWTSWWPVYGGGGSIPNDGVGGYHRLKDFYVSGSSSASTQRIQIKKP